MDEHDLRALGAEPLGPVGRPRAVDDVLRRGGRLRRRATMVRAAPVVVVIALAASAGILALRDDRPPEPEFSTSPPASLLPQRPHPCDSTTEPAPAAELEGLRLTPTTLPDGVAVATMTAQRYNRGTCVEVDPALVLRAGGGNGAIDAEIILTGPYAEPFRATDGVALEPTTQLRGGEASRVFDPTAPDSYAAFTWTEPDGASWLLKGVGVDETTVRDVAERLELRPAADEGEPVAALPDDAMPAGFEVAWQAQGTPAVEGPTRLEWRVTTTPARPDGCEVTINTTALEAPTGQLFSAGSVASEVDVRGRPGVAIEQDGSVYLYWMEEPGVAAWLVCGGDLDTALRVADSLVEVEPDDPRIVTAAPANGSSG